jgi:hypothetical protein
MKKLGELSSIALALLAGVPLTARGQLPGPAVSTPVAVTPVTAAPPPVAAAAPRNIWSFLCLTDAQKAKCKAQFCGSQFGQLINNSLAPASALTGGVISQCCPGPAGDPANLLKPADTPLGAAGRVQADTAAAAERRAVVRYLSTVDCNWWPEARAALINALRADRNECVRLEAALALQRGCCCNKDTIKALVLTVSGGRDDDNPAEDSPRVRAAAMAALEHCLCCYVSVTPAPPEEPPPAEQLPTPRKEGIPPPGTPPGKGPLPPPGPPPVAKVKPPIRPIASEAPVQDPNTDPIVQRARLLVQQAKKARIAAAAAAPKRQESLTEVLEEAFLPSVSSPQRPTSLPEGHPASAANAAGEPAPLPAPFGLLPSIGAPPSSRWFTAPPLANRPTPIAPSPPTRTRSAQSSEIPRIEQPPSDRRGVADQGVKPSVVASPPSSSERADSMMGALAERACADKSTEVRLACLYELLERQASHPALLNLLRPLETDGDARVRQATRAVELVVLLRNSSEPEVRQRAATALASCDVPADPVVQALSVSARTDSVASVRRACWLGLLELQKAKPTLLILVTGPEDPDPQVREIARALQLVNQLQKPADPKLRDQAAPVLNVSPQPSCLPTPNYPAPQYPGTPALPAMPSYSSPTLHPNCTPGYPLPQYPGAPAMPATPTQPATPTTPTRPTTPTTPTTPSAQTQPGTPRQTDQMQAGTPPQTNQTGTTDSGAGQEPSLGGAQGTAGEGSSVALASPGGYLDNPIPITTFRIRYDAAWDLNTPDRAEYFYGAWRELGFHPHAVNGKGVFFDPKALGPEILPQNVNYQQPDLYLEYAFNRRFSAFIDTPYRFVNFNHPEEDIPEAEMKRNPADAPAPGSKFFPEGGPENQGNQQTNYNGFSDFQFGFKAALIAKPDQYATFQFRTYSPTANASQGLGTGHWSVEPSLLLYQRLNRFTLQGQLTEWTPIHGGEAGNIIEYGAGVGYYLYQRGNFSITPIAEFLGWTCLNGYESVFKPVSAPPTPGLELPTTHGVVDVTGDTIVNAKFGVRTYFADGSSLYFGYGHALTGDHWYTDIFRVEYRVFFGPNRNARAL